MSTKLLSGLTGVLLLSIFSALAGQEANEKDSERYIRESQRQWAESVRNRRYWGS